MVFALRPDSPETAFQVATNSLSSMQTSLSVAETPAGGSVP